MLVLIVICVDMRVGPVRRQGLSLAQASLPQALQLDLPGHSAE